MWSHGYLRVLLTPKNSPGYLRGPIGPLGPFRRISSRHLRSPIALTPKDFLWPPKGDHLNKNVNVKYMHCVKNSKVESIIVNIGHSAFVSLIGIDW